MKKDYYIVMPGSKRILVE